jgi:hypothetical protein
MGKLSTILDDSTISFIRAQAMFFVASAPLDAAGHVNLSPKGLDTFRVLDNGRVAYLDFTGSGIETVAHIKENGRVVIMFCAFEGPPKIVRLHGRGRVIEPGDAEFEELRLAFPDFEGVRAVIVIELARVSESCGFGVPRFKYEGERTQMQSWAKQKGSDGLKTYRENKNRSSIDGLRGLR